MSASRSGFIIEVPLGLWSSAEFAFIEEAGSARISHVEAHIVDETGVFDLPPALREFAAVYMKTWLTVVRKDEDGSVIFEPVPWAGEEFWQSQTHDRLTDLVEQGQARREEDLD